MKPTHAEITFVNHDPRFDGFAQVGEMTVEDYNALPEIDDPRPDGAYGFLADLKSGEDTILADKYLTDEMVEKIFGKPIAEVVSIGRQRLAQINDEDSEYIQSRRRATA